MTTLIAFHEVQDGQTWKDAWQKETGSRHELFAKIGVTARTFQDSNDPKLTGFIFEVPDMEQFQTFLSTDEVQKAAQEDGVKFETLRMLNEFSR